MYLIKFFNLIYFTKKIYKDILQNNKLINIYGYILQNKKISLNIYKIKYNLQIYYIYVYSFFF